MLLIRAITAISNLKGANEDQTHGIQIALRAMAKKSLNPLETPTLSHICRLDPEFSVVRIFACAELALIT
ncbi:hypothetical protein FUT78_08560 [Xylella fastidiosa subsp. fastidiosa]|nr:hypothetical protein [Xylella fastidiosa subsp. fastidiosa]